MRRAAPSRTSTPARARRFLNFSETPCLPVWVARGRETRAPMRDLWPTSRACARVRAEICDQYAGVRAGAQARVRVEISESKKGNQA